MIGVYINLSQIEKMASCITSLLKDFEPDSFTNTNYYPAPGTDKETLTRYFLVMVAMDHRLSRPGRPYEGYIDGVKYHGADLLYKLGMMKLSTDPSFFSPERLAIISKEDVKKWLSPKGVPTPLDLDVRTKLLRDIGVKLNALYRGSAFRLVENSKGYLRWGGDGLVERLKIFLAYSDPVEKKPFLLAKFLERRRVIEILDHWNKEVPVDNHVSRLAIRWGLVDIDSNTLERIAGNTSFTMDEDVLLRYSIRIAFKLLSQRSGIDPFILDDFLWSFGRSLCRRDNPLCIEDRCPLSPCCRAFRDRLYMVGEHKYYETWHY